MAMVKRAIYPNYRAYSFLRKKQYLSRSPLGRRRKREKGRGENGEAEVRD